MTFRDWLYDPESEEALKKLWDNVRIHPVNFDSEEDELRNIADSLYAEWRKALPTLAGRFCATCGAPIEKTAIRG